MRMMELSGKSGNSKIFIGESISHLASLCTSEKTVIVTDRNVRKFHGEKFPDFPVLEVGLGEESKTLPAVQALYGKFMEMELERGSMVIGIGGGIVCDISGFAASTYLRGMRLGLVPTTLIAQADAAIGGKNGVNLGGYKNLVGTIRHPEFVLCDFSFLSTLPEKERRCGFAEVIKHAAIADATLFSYLEGNLQEAMELKRSVIEKVIHDSILVKTEIVAKDEYEKGERRKLNFGHTVGHAIEKCCCLPHGEAVAIGMVAEAQLSVSRKLLSEKDAGRLMRLLADAGLPAKAKATPSGLLDAMRKDKKRESEIVKMALLEGIGKCSIQDVKMGEIEAVLSGICIAGKGGGSP
ncbi:MAG: 3-dehydroquinate synthase [Candidatus Micrarchaeota archaeon]|nr:3-dehydroquinate synthase [Candidatus Micrarchaeota archaeon]